MRNEISQTDEQIEDIFAELGFGIAADEDVILTRETIADWKDSRQGWRAKGSVELDEPVDDCHIYHVRAAQTLKGRPRRDVIVVDFGTVRGVAQI